MNLSTLDFCLFPSLVIDIVLNHLQNCIGQICHICQSKSRSNEQLPVFDVVSYLSLLADFIRSWLVKTTLKFQADKLCKALVFSSVDRRYDYFLTHIHDCRFNEVAEGGRNDCNCTSNDS